jgi:hypothetical protein
VVAPGKEKTMLTQKVARTLNEVWTWVPGDLPGGTSMVVTTTIPVDRDQSMTEANANRFLLHNQDARAIYKETARAGAPSVSDPEITVNASGFLVVTVACAGGALDQSGGELEITLIHSATR